MINRVNLLRPGIALMFSIPLMTTFVWMDDHMDGHMDGWSHGWMITWNTYKKNLYTGWPCRLYRKLFAKVRIFKLKKVKYTFAQFFESKFSNLKFIKNDNI